MAVILLSVLCTLMGWPQSSKLPDGQTFDFNISHDGSLVVCAFLLAEAVASGAPRTEIGVDVMRLALPPWADSNVDLIDTLADYLNRSEKAFIDAAQAHPEEQLLRTFRIWTLKEAYTKALGLGLGVDFSRVELAFDGPTVSLSMDGASAHEWTLQEDVLEDEHGTYLIAIAYRAPPCSDESTRKIEIARRSVDDILAMHAKSK